ncbi:MAG: ABC transporter ATP-binding protein [Cyanophyceae cyanobacterium]
MVAAVVLKDVYKLYKQVPVVDGLSFSIEAGEMFGLLGPNGAGKTTTIRMLITLTKPTQGQIEVAGFPISQPAKIKQNIGVVLQQTSVDGDLSVWENMEFHGRMHHIPHPRRQQLIEQWLEYVELTERRDALAKTLSGGMKRRLQIARALLHYPQVLFLDEPTVGLDPQTRRRLWEIIRDLNRQGMTIVLTTHYMEEAEFLCDRLGIMNAGRLIELGTPEALRSRYGKGLVVQGGDRLEYKFFADLAAAHRYLDSQPDKTGMMSRESNLEDIFVELTGRQLG